MRAVPGFWVGLAFLQVIPARTLEVHDVALLCLLGPNKPFIDQKSELYFCDAGRPLKFVKFVLSSATLTVELELAVDSAKALAG